MLRQASDDGYLALGVPRDVLSLASKPGRALQVGSPHEIQLAILGVDVNIAAQTRALEGLIAELTPLRPPPRHDQVSAGVAAGE